MEINIKGYNSEFKLEHIIRSSKIRPSFNIPNAVALLLTLILSLTSPLSVYFPQCIQGNHAIAKMTARCAQYVSALKIIVGLGKRKISRRLRKNLHITIRR